MTDRQRKEEREVARVEDREERAKERRHLVRPMIMVFASMFALTAANITYTTIAVQMNAQVWCDLVSNLDDQYKATPPPTASGQVFASDIHKIRVKYHCK